MRALFESIDDFVSNDPRKRHAAAVPHRANSSARFDGADHMAYDSFPRPSSD